MITLPSLSLSGATPAPQVIQIPGDSGIWRSLVFRNQGPYTLTLSIGPQTQNIDPWTADEISLVGNTYSTINVTSTLARPGANLSGTVLLELYSEQEDAPSGSFPSPISGPEITPTGPILLGYVVSNGTKTATATFNLQNNGTGIIAVALGKSLGNPVLTQIIGGQSTFLYGSARTLIGGIIAAAIPGTIDNPITVKCVTDSATGAGSQLAAVYQDTSGSVKQAYSPSTQPVIVQPEIVTDLAPFASVLAGGASVTVFTAAGNGASLIDLFVEIDATAAAFLDVLVAGTVVGNFPGNAGVWRRFKFGNFGMGAGSTVTIKNEVGGAPVTVRGMLSAISNP